MLSPQLPCPGSLLPSPQACRDAYPKSVNRCLWVVAELAIVATDLAEVVGCAIAFNLLFGIPLWAGVLITFADVLVVMLFEAKSFRALEILVAVLTVLISVRGALWHGATGGARFVPSSLFGMSRGGLYGSAFESAD